MAITIDPVIITARVDAIEGGMSWTMPVPKTPSLMDIATQGYAAICYDGSRAPKMAACIYCRKLTSHAWRIHPVNFTVAACTGDCVADKVQDIWDKDEGLVCIRVRGEQALTMLFGRPRSAA